MNNVEHVVFSSSDKAVNVSNVLGGTKLLAEKLITAAQTSSSTNFCSVRFGNVIRSSGSVVPVFEKRLENDQPLIVNDSEMTRFFMKSTEAVELILEAPTKSIGGDIFVLKMLCGRIRDLAEAMLELKYGPKSAALKKHEMIQYGRSSFGEKLHEELLTREEANRAVEWEEMFQILPPNYDLKTSNAPILSSENTKRDFIYSSQFVTKMTKAEIIELLTAKQPDLS